MYHEKTPPVYRDTRFWMALTAVLLLAWLATRHYPLSAI